MEAHTPKEEQNWRAHTPKHKSSIVVLHASSIKIGIEIIGMGLKVQKKLVHL